MIDQSNSLSDIAPLVSAHHLKKTFTVGLRRKKVQAVTNSTFELMPNEVVGLVGPNGAGKTTTMKMLTGLVRPDAGSATLFGFPVQSPEGRRRLGYLPENPYFYEHLTGAELLRFYGNLFGLRSTPLKQRIEDLIERVGLKEAADRAIKNYSKGMRQRIGIAQALINNPDLIILDEPQSGLDPLGRRDVRNLILEQKGLGKTILFSSHILPDVEAVCDRIIVMKAGRTVELNSDTWTHLRSTEIRHISARKGSTASELPKLIEALEKITDVTHLESDPDLLRLSTHTSLARELALHTITDAGWLIDTVEEPQTDYESLLLTVLDSSPTE